MMFLCRAALTLIYSSSFYRQVPESLHAINYGLIQLVADEILASYRTEKPNASKRRAPRQLYVEASKIAFRRFSVDDMMSPQLQEHICERFALGFIVSKGKCWNNGQSPASAFPR